MVQLPEVKSDPHRPMDEYYPAMRDERREYYAGRRPARRRRAIQTIVHNEPVFLPIWLAYYSRFFGEADIYVLDNDTDDGSTAGSGFNRLGVSHGQVDHRWMADTLADHLALLLDSYDAVLTTDVDELVAPVPEWGDLGQYLDRFDEEWVNCVGYEILHMRDREPPLQLDRPILDQRGYWFGNDGYSKPLLTSQPMRWVPGLHNRSDGKWNLDPDLRLVHLHRMDFDLCRNRHAVRVDRAWQDEDVEKKWAAHNRLVAEEEFERWFYEDNSLNRFSIELEEIPAGWRGRF